MVVVVGSAELANTSGATTISSSPFAVALFVLPVPRRRRRACFLLMSSAVPITTSSLLAASSVGVVVGLTNDALPLRPLRRLL